MYYKVSLRKNKLDQIQFDRIVEKSPVSFIILYQITLKLRRTHTRLILVNVVFVRLRWKVTLAEPMTELRFGREGKENTSRIQEEITSSHKNAEKSRISDPFFSEPGR